MNQPPNPYRPAKGEEEKTGQSNAPAFVFPIASVVITLAFVSFVLGVVVPFSYASRKTNPNAPPLPAYLNWVDNYDTATLAAMAVFVPLLVLLMGACARAVAPPSLLPYIPWWRKSFREVLRRHKRN